MNGGLGRMLALLMVVGVASAGLAACGDGGGTSAAASSPAGTPVASPAAFTPVDPPSPGPASPGPSPSAVEATPVNPCLVSVRAVSRVLAGTWTRRRQGQTCAYSSDRGAIFAIQEVEESDLKGGLKAARSECTSTPREVPETASFACVERDDGSDLVMGNAIARNRLWIFMIVPAGRGKHSAELAAMTALLQRALVV